jgi:hypothetical protein
MRERRAYFVAAAAAVLAVLSLTAGLWAAGVLRTNSGEPASAVSGTVNPIDGEGIIPNQAASSSGDPLIFSYGAKFVCLEGLQPGSLYYGAAAPVVRESTEVVVHNPQNAAVDVYKKAVRARLEDAPEIEPSGKLKVTLQADHSFRVDCDDITRVLTGNPSATFIGTYGIGVKVEGYVVLHTLKALDVTAQYRRGSEVLKKDISYQPWWSWWWWSLPWRLGYPYERVVNVSITGNIDCRGALYDALHQDVTSQIPDSQLAAATHNALEAGRAIDPTNVSSLSQATQPALVALIGSCDKYLSGGNTVADIDYVLVSNKGSTDPNPISGGDPGIVYPWVPGRFYNLNAVFPNSTNVDMDDYIRTWLRQRWLDAGRDAGSVSAAMVYFYPWWCGNGFWNWWNGGDCIDIGVGEGESLDVEQLTPQRVFCAVFPPIDNNSNGVYDEGGPDPSEC